MNDVKHACMPNMCNMVHGEVMRQCIMLRTHMTVSRSGYENIHSIKGKGGDHL